MLAAVSHDLRTPITSLRLRAEFVEDAESKTKIYAAFDEMQRMIVDALAFISEDMQREEARKVDLNVLIDNVAADLAELGHDIEAIESDRALIVCRPVPLRRALRNLMESAAIYGTRATVRLDADDAATRIAIEDEGPGIPEEDQERVLDPSVRLEASRSRDTGGSGLVLVIARSIVRGHGGGVPLGNCAKGGLRATISLPAAERSCGMQGKCPRPEFARSIERRRQDWILTPGLFKLSGTGAGPAQKSAGLRTVSGVGKGGIVCESPRLARGGIGRGIEQGAP